MRIYKQNDQQNWVFIEVRYFQFIQYPHYSLPNHSPEFVQSRSSRDSDFNLILIYWIWPKIRIHQKKPQPTAVIKPPEQKWKIVINEPQDSTPKISPINTPQQIGGLISGIKHRKNQSSYSSLLDIDFGDSEAKHHESSNSYQDPQSMVISFDGQNIGNHIPGFLELSISRRNSVLASNIPIEYVDQGILSLNTMIEILECTPDIIQEQYIRHTDSIRKNRRQLLIRKEYQNYFDTIISDSEEQFTLLQNGFDQVCESIRVSTEVFQDSFIQYSHDTKIGQEFMERLTFVQQNLKELMPSINHIKRKKGISIIKYQLEILQSSCQLLVMIQQLENRDSIALILNVVLDDLIYEEFQIEEEDKIKFLSIQ